METTTAVVPFTKAKVYSTTFVCSRPSMYIIHYPTPAQRVINNAHEQMPVVIKLQGTTRKGEGKKRRKEI